MADHIDTIVFDFDDTLTDFDGLERVVWERVAEIISASFPAADMVELRSRYLAAMAPNYERVLRGELDLLGYRRARLTEALLPWGAPDDALFDEYVQEKTRLLDEVPLHDDALETLRRLRRRGLRLGVLTNGPSGMQRQKLDRLRIAEEVDAIAVSEEIGIAKPHPLAYAAMLEMLGAEPSRAAMIGDDLVNDVEGPLRAGFAAAVWMQRRGAELPDGVVAITRLEQVPEVLGLAV